MTAAMVRALLGGILAVGPVLAQPAKVTPKRVESILQRAVNDYDALEFDAARTTLEEAFAAVHEGQLGETKVAARAHAVSAVVWIGGLRDRYRGFQALLTALRIDPGVKIPDTVATPEMLEILQRARDALAAQKGAAKAEKGPPGTRPAAPEVRGLVHERVDEAWSGFDIPVQCELGPDVPAVRVVLYYRPSDREEFEEVALGSREGSWGGQIPEAATRGRYIHYYLEAHDRRGRAVAQNGSAASPNLIMLRGMSPRAPKDVETVTEARVALGHRWTAAIGVGTGMGLLGKSESENCGANPGSEGCIPIGDMNPEVPINSGAALAPFHILAEVGYRLTPRWEASAQLRFQAISGSQVKQFDKKSYLGTVRFRRWLGHGRLKLFFGTAIGVGEVRHAVDLGPDGGEVTDTLTSGILAFGGGGGLAYEIADGLSVIGALDGLVLLPDNSAFHADVNLGFRYAF